MMQLSNDRSDVLRLTAYAVAAIVFWLCAVTGGVVLVKKGLLWLTSLVG